MDEHFCPYCGRDDTHLPEGCGCRNGAVLPNLTVGAVIKFKIKNDSEAE